MSLDSKFVYEYNAGKNYENLSTSDEVTVEYHVI